MKISVVGPAHPYKGGAAQHTTALAHHLAAAGHDVTIESWIAQYPRVLYPGRPTVDSPELPLFRPTSAAAVVAAARWAGSGTDAGWVVPPIW